MGYSSAHHVKHHNVKARMALDRAIIPSCLQHHDCVFSLVGAGWGERDIDVRNATAARVAMPTTRHPTFLNTSIGSPGSERLQPCCQCMELMDKSKAGWHSFYFPVLACPHAQYCGSQKKQSQHHPSTVPQVLVYLLRTLPWGRLYEYLCTCKYFFWIAHPFCLYTLYVQNPLQLPVVTLGSQTESLTENYHYTTLTP